MGPVNPVEIPGVITVEHRNGETVMCLVGKIDLMVVEAFEADHGCMPMRVDAIDAGQVTFISSKGVQLLLRSSQRSAQLGSPTLLRRSSPALDLVLRITGLAGQIRRPSHHLGAE